VAGPGGDASGWRREMLKIVTYNVNGLRPRVAQHGSLRRLLDALDADIICFQVRPIADSLLTKLSPRNPSSRLHVLITHCSTPASPLRLRCTVLHATDANGQSLKFIATAT